MLWSYGKEAQSIGVGTAGGGTEIPGVSALPTLDWAAFSRDLRLARRLTDDVHVFSLEGCVRQGFLERLADFDWSEPVAPPSEYAEQVGGIRRTLRAVLWADAHALEVLVGLIAAVWLLRPEVAADSARLPSRFRAVHRGLSHSSSEEREHAVKGK